MSPDEIERQRLSDAERAVKQAIRLLRPHFASIVIAASYQKPDPNDDEDTLTQTVFRSHGDFNACLGLSEHNAKRMRGMI